MPGKIGKSPLTHRVGNAMQKSVQRTASIPRRPTVTPRIPPQTARHTVSVPRIQQQVAKREAVRQEINKIQPRPRPVVRPAAKPLKNMPKSAPPPQTPLKSIQRGVPPRPAPASLPKSMPRTPSQPAAAPGQVKSMNRGAVAAGAAVAGVAAAGALLALNTASAHPNISMDVNSLQSTLTDLQDRSDFSGILADITALDANIHHMLNLLESARQRHYAFQSDLEDIAYQSVDRWQAARSQVETAIDQQTRLMQTNLVGLNPYIQRLNANLGNAATAGSSLSATQTQVNQFKWDIEKAERAIQGQYEEIESNVQKLTNRLTTIHWALDQLAEARFSLEEEEDLVMAVATRWDKEGKDDPEGILYLSNKRLIFERKEKVATKKVLFVTTASELVQDVLFAQPLGAVQEIKAQSKGLFGHQDFLEVRFADKALGTLSLHLNGQDSKEWAVLIERARSGQIENERTSGSSLSFEDLSGPLTQADLLAAQTEFNALQDEMMLKGVRDDLSELENKMRSLERTLAGLRARGYAVEKNLESDLTVLASQWDRIKARTDVILEHQARTLNEQLGALKDALVALMGMSANLGAARPKYVQFKSMMASAEAQTEAAEATVFDQYDEYADEVESLDTHFEWVDWMLEALATASFRLLATESGVAATEAIWLRPGLEPENGILYLTDQRLLWEDRVGDYELKIAVPLQQVTNAQEVSPEEAEFDVLEIAFDSADAPVPAAQFQLAMPVAEDWLQMIGRARAGDYAQDRAIPLDEAEMERIRNAPQQCSNCGASFTAPVLRGQTEIACEYCSVVIRI